MMKKRLSKKIWYGSDVDSEGKPILPPLAKDSEDLEGLHYGELYLHIGDDKLSLWTRTLTDQIKQIGGEGSGGELWKLMETENGEKYIFSAFDIATQKGITMYTDGGMLDLPSIYDGLPLDNDTIYWEEIKDEEGNVIGKRIKARGGSGEGCSADFSNVISSGEGNAFTSFVLSNDKKTLTFVKDKTFATVSDLDSRVNALVNGAPAAYDTLKEIADVLQGNVNSIGDIVTALGGKANKATTLAGYGITDAKISNGVITLGGNSITPLTSHQTIYNLTLQAGTFSAATFDPNGGAKTVYIPTTTSHISEGSNLYFTNKRAVSALSDTLKAYVTLSGTQTITGEKDFTGGLKVNGSPIVYDKTKKYWKFEGDLLVTGGITMYGLDGSSFGTIWDNAPIATTSSKGIASFDPNYFSVSNGYVTFIGQTGGGTADSVTWGNVTGKPSWITTTKPEYQYTEIKGTPDLAGYVTLSGNQTITGEKTFESSIKIKRGFSILDDQGWGIVGVNSTAWTGLPTDGSAIGFGTGAAPVYIRTSGDDLYHYDKTKDAAYKIIDSNNIANYKVGDSIKFNGFSMRTDSAFENKAVDANINYIIDATSLSTSYFYPIVFPYSPKDLYVRMYSTSGSANAAYNQNKLEFTFRGQGWTDAPNGLTVHFYSCYDAKETTIGCIAMGEAQGYKVVWVRGGLTYYVTSNITPTLYKDGITFTNEKYSYGVNFYGGTNTNVKVYWTPQATSGLGAMYHSGSIGTYGSLNVKGISIYKSDEGYLFIDGDLVVKGGITMYGTDGTAAPTIWEGAPKATTSNTTNGKGVASFDSKFFSVSNGHVTFIGDVGGLDESALASYLSTNKYLTQTTGDARYLAIGGNAVSASGLSGLTPIISAANESNEISAVRNNYGAITTNAPTSGAAITNALKFRWYDTDWQIGNVRNMSNGTSGFGVTYGSSNLRFLVKTDGIETYGTLKTNGVIPASNGSYSLGSSSSKWASVYATSFEGNATTATNATNASYVYTNTSSTDFVFPVVFTSNYSKGNQTLFVDSASGAGYNPSTNTFVASCFSGSSVSFGDGTYSNLTTKGWYRFAAGGYENSQSGAYIFFIRRQYQTSRNESFVISATVDYGRVVFNQISGATTDNLISKIRATNVLNGRVNFDFYYEGSSSAHRIYVNAIGNATLQAPTSVSSADSYVTEMSLKDGFVAGKSLTCYDYKNLAFIHQKSGKNLLANGDVMVKGNAYAMGSYSYDSSVTNGRTYRLTICAKLGSGNTHIVAYWDGGSGNNTTITGLSSKEERIVTFTAKITNKQVLTFYQFPNGKFGSYVRWAYLEEAYKEGELSSTTDYNNWLTEYDKLDTKSFLHKIRRIDVGDSYWSADKGIVMKGSLTLNGTIYSPNGVAAMKIANISGTYQTVMSMDHGNNFVLGYDTAASSYDTYIDGFNMHFRTGNAHSEIFTLGSAGGAKLYLKTAALIIKRNHSSGGAYTQYQPCNQENRSWSAGVNNSYQYSWWYQNVSSGIDVQKMYLDSSGNLLTTGGITMYSDLRKKTILNHVELSLKEVAEAPLIEHYYNSDEAKTTHVGSVAQYWAGLNDWFCKEDGEGFLTMEIQNAALASAISVARELTRYESKTDKQIKKLKKRIGELEEEIENLKNK